MLDAQGEHPMCPMCGSSAVTETDELRAIAIPYGGQATYGTKVHHCSDCGESGDFTQQNDAIIQSAYREAKKKSVDPMLGYLGSIGVSMAYIERALELPVRTLARWKTEECSAAAIALLRIIRTYPWILQVADARFDERVAKVTLLKETAGIVGDMLGTVMSAHSMQCRITVSFNETPQVVDMQPSSTLNIGGIPTLSVDMPVAYQLANTADN